MRIGSSSGATGEFDGGVGRVRWQEEEDGLRVKIGRWRKGLRWTEITRAALTRSPGPQVPSNFPKQVLPGLGSLFALQKRLSAETRQLILARGPGTHRVIRILIPDGDPEGARLVDVVRAHLGDRWLEEIPFERHQEALGLRNPWWYFPVGLIGCLGLGYMILLAMMGVAAVLYGRAGEAPLIVWMALALWILLVVWLLSIYRRRP
jgi:hypothetical protein